MSSLLLSKKMKPVRIVKNIQITKNAFITSLDHRPEFIPGQVIEIAETLSLPPRMYSICSAPDNNTLDILFDVKEEGRLTPLLAGMKARDTIFVGEPMGNFNCPDNEKAFWIAAGTGIAPFYSMFRAGNMHNKFLVHGGRSPGSFYFNDHFQPVLKDKYIRCCTGAKEEGLYHGRLSSWLLEQNELPLDYKYYLCGSAEMVVQTRDIIVGKGIAFDRIMAEIYF
jgi:ferredoxin--NADP+ reductase